MRTTLALAALAAFATPAMTQTKFQVLPSKALVKMGNGIDTWSLNGTTSTRNLQRSQQLIATSEFSVASASLKAMSLRRSHISQATNPAATYDVTLRLAVNSASTSNPSLTFATNLGSSSTTVFKGKVLFPQRPLGTTWPDPWEGPLGFTTTFAFSKTAGSTFIIDTTQTGAVRWLLEHYQPEFGSWGVEFNQPSTCVTRSKDFGVPGRGVGTILPEPLYPGGSFTAAFVPTDSRGTPPNVPGYPNNVASFQNSFLMLALVGKTGSFGGNKLPVTLQRLGLPNTDSACALGIQWIPGLQLPLTYRKGILPSFGNLGSLSLQPAVAIPFDSRLAGVRFYVQAVSDDNSYIYPSSALWAQLGSGASVPGAVVYRTNDNPSNPSGTGQTIRKGAITAVRLSY
ncbi:MAG: hypothetical protein ACYST0_12595 [Planctomycetota bacterium]|jgi:hypothetical protein